MIIKMEVGANVQEHINPTPKTPENNEAIEKAEAAAEQATHLAVENFSSKTSAKVENITTYPGAGTTEAEEAKKIGEEATKKMLASLMEQLTDWQAKQAKGSRSAPRAIKYTVDEVTAFCQKNGLPIPQAILDATVAPKEKKVAQKIEAPIETVIETPAVQSAPEAEIPTTPETPIAQEAPAAEMPAVEAPAVPVETAQVTEPEKVEIPAIETQAEAVPIAKIETPTVEIPKINIDTTTRKLSTLPDHSLDKNVAFQIAGIADKETGAMLEKSWGGNAKKALLEIDKFKDTTANELARTLVEKGKGNTVYTIEDDIADEKAKGIYRQSEDTLAKYIKEANGDEEKGIHAMKSELPGQYSNLVETRALISKMEKLAGSLDRQALFDTAITRKNEITPQSLDFFKKKNVDFNDLIGKLIENKYTKESLLDFVKNAPDNSLTPDIAKKLAAKDPDTFEGIDKKFANKFVAE